MVHKTCGYGDCRSDSRKENLDNVTFISFPRDTGKNHEKCLRWITLSGRIDLTPERVNRYTYVCSKHFVGGNGPTDEYPDPVQFPGKISRIPRGIHGNMRVAPHHAIQKAAKKAKTFTVTSAAQLNNLQNANYFSLVKQEPGYSDFTSGQQGSDTTRNQTKSIKFLVKDWGSCVESDCGLTSGYVDDDHPKDIMMQMFDMWKEQKMCDAAFIVQGTKVPFHRLMMSACSSHMKTVLDREDLTSSVDIQMPDSVSIEGMYCFLHYIYTGSLSLTINTAQAVLKIATILRVTKVQHHCKQYIENIAGKLGLNPTPTQPVRFTVSREEEAVVGRSEDRRTVVIPDPSASEPAGDLPRNFCSESGTVSLETHCDRVADAGNGRSVSDHVNVMDTAGADFSSSDTSLLTCMKNRASLPANMISQRHCMASNFTVSSGRQFCHLEQPGQNSPSSAEVCQSDCYHGNTGPSSICSGQWSSKMTDSGVQGIPCVEEGEETDMVGSDTETFIKQEPGHDSDLEPCVFFEEQP
ncbi:uncharacterized protein LOC124112163 [Haliotis rufescens]|uniref:uncharacterized protein LOC124112163 n=1 Tax=Haliotis rufescens TaxID=6454 RepID=UPI001EAF9542|nr:uncharacterized protein LOC124112163 [Haliotis rufescens]